MNKKDLVPTEEGKKLGTQVVINPIERMEYALSILDIQEKFVKRALNKGKDYDIIPGTQKPTLLKPGAEKLNSLFNLQPEFEEITNIENWDKPLFFYRYRCRLINKSTGEVWGEGIGSCNSRETKYRYRWLWGNEVPPDVDKASLTLKEFTSKQGKKYKKYRMENQDVAEQVNTIDKMAQKRAYVAATLIATQTSDRFTQDMEDRTHFAEDNAIDAEYEDVSNNKTPPPKGNDTISENEYGDMIALIIDTNVTPQEVFFEFKKRHNITSLTKIPKKFFPEIIDWIKENAKPKEGKKK